MAFPGTNVVIYGHNMRDGSMFGDLDFYKDEAFYEEHSIITFDTLYECHNLLKMTNITTHYFTLFATTTSRPSST